MLDKCTVCDKPFDTIFTEVTLNAKVLRKREDSTIENLENCEWQYTEFLCEDCLKALCDSITSSLKTRL